MNGLKKYLLGGIRYLKASIDIIVFSVRKCVVRLKFPFKFKQIIKSEMHYELNNGNAYEIISSIRSDNGSFCTRQIDPKGKKDNKLTIIIPVFNVESYIEECIDSILSQDTEYEFSIHIVDDGSTDTTLSKVINYAEKYNYIKVSTQKNSSQSVARNNALNVCDSEWVMMVDGDDILARDAIQTLMNIAIKDNCDVVEGNVLGFQYKWDDNTNTVKKRHLNIHSSLDQNFILTSKGYSCGKLYKRSLWNNVRYPERYIFEDIITKYVICRKAYRYARTNQVIYGYRLRNDSSSHSNDNRKLDCLWVMNKIQIIRENNGIPNDAINHTLMMNHFGMLTPLMVAKEDLLYQKAAIEIARHNIERWKVSRSNLPYFFRKSYDAIMALNVEAWMLTFKTIADYRFITHFREIN